MNRLGANNNENKERSPTPKITLPKGGGAIKGIDEKFSVNPATGTCSFSVPIITSPSRSNFQPQLALNYDSGAGNGVFGLGWNISVPGITRKTGKGIPKYRDDEESDTFVLSGAEDLVPLLIEESPNKWQRKVKDDANHKVYYYRPRIEGLFARIERWVNKNTGISHWRSVTKDNVTTLYGESEAARVADPQDKQKIFQWLLEKSYDAHGNVIIYKYQEEKGEDIDPSYLHEKNRNNHIQAFTNRYLKHIYYGNTISYHENTFNQQNKWHFKVVFDYGNESYGITQEPGFEPWPEREDPFSDYRAGFEIRTYKLCRRVLMYHNFTELGNQPYLVASTNMKYQRSPVLTLLTSITHMRYEQGQPPKHLPPITLKYSEAKIDRKIHTIERSELENMPPGGNGGSSEWFDLEGEGLTGILSHYEDSWYYQRNEGNAEFAGKRLVSQIPSQVMTSRKQYQLMDLGGDGRQNLVTFSDEINGFYELDEKGRWENFVAFKTIPNINWQDSNLRMIDLNGDGHADILITEDHCFTWYPSEAKDGFHASGYVSKLFDEEKGPAVIFADGTQTIFLADMSGDGLVDITRIKNGEVCYWPNLGYARYGAKITMDQSPVFDTPDGFDPSRIRLADIDGSGTTDIFYLSGDTITYWINQSGNSWAEGEEISNFPRVDNLSSVTVMDLLGNGTACIVWTSPLKIYSRQPLKYIDLMSSTKPYLLNEIDNNMGAVTWMQYTSSTKFYLEDRKQGKPWITKIPFPVHVLERSEVYDEISKNAYVTRYAYHHGYFDGEEREFRGFGMVEQWDTEDYNSFLNQSPFAAHAYNWNEESYVPPVYTKTWFHTGFYMTRDNISKHYQDKEYYMEDAGAWLLADTHLSGNLSAEEIREACRALKGSVLRQEVYAEDNQKQSSHPYTVTENKYDIVRVQPRQDNKYASFYVYESESLNYHYEQNPSDPRILHEMTLEIDNYGHVKKSASTAYPRRKTQYDEQKKLLITYTENDFINADQDRLDYYLLGIPYETRTYEITGNIFKQGTIIQKDDLHGKIHTASIISYEEKPNFNTIQKRLIEHTRILYYKKDLNGSLQPGQIAFHALPYESYTKAFTASLIQKIYGVKLDVNTRRDILDREAGYIFMDNAWWIPSGKQLFDVLRFYLPVESIDPFNNSIKITYDNYSLLINETEDPVGNTVTAENDYRVLQPYEVTDANGNRSKVAFDTLGMVTATALMGKRGRNEGDTIDNPTTKLTYDLFNWMNNNKPNYVFSQAREEHQDNNTRWQKSYTYSDGFGREIMQKVQAEPGEAFARDAQGNLKRINDQLVRERTEHRWVGNGRTLFNNKGKPVKQYEPYFSSTSDYEDEKELVEYGLSPVIHYDPLERVICTDFPDGSYSKVEFDAWMQINYDQNDTAFDPVNPANSSKWYLYNIGQLPNTPKHRAAKLTEAHANTPQIIHLDTLGRNFLTIDDNGNEGKYETKVKFDIEGNQLEIEDAKQRIIAENKFDISGEQIWSWSADAGESWILNNVLDNPARTWDSKNHVVRFEYDKLQRPTHVYLQYENNREKLVEFTIYGETHQNAKDHNLNGQPYQSYDQAGVLTNEEFDFKGNLLSSKYQLVKYYDKTICWSHLENYYSIGDIENAAAPILTSEAPFTTELTYDALNRPITMKTADESIVYPGYNEANFMEKVEVRIRGELEEKKLFINNIDYNEKGQRVKVEYANGIKTADAQVKIQTKYQYDPDTFRLIRLTTRRTDNTLLQDFQYYYDPVGNITEIKDNAQQRLFFNNQVVEPHCKYVYDAIYRLTEVQGREHGGQQANKPHDHEDYPVFHLPHPNNALGLRRYKQEYHYDAVGNITEMIHRASQHGWTRKYKYEVASNRLDSTSRSASGSYSDIYKHDKNGNIIQMPGLNVLAWDHEDQLKKVELGGGGKVYFTYNSEGERVRKVAIFQNGTVKERIYLGDYEIFREYNSEADLVSGNINKERETLHVMDNKSRIALIETETYKDNEEITRPGSRIRYQFSNHLESSCIETRPDGKRISFEEYYPYGWTSYHSTDNTEEVSAKRYRYNGKERDEETGLYYYGARYYIAWLGRWLSCDPAGIVDGVNLYTYVKSNPVGFNDSSGLRRKSPNQRENRRYQWLIQGYKEDKNRKKIYNNLSEESTETADKLKSDIDEYRELELYLQLSSLSSTNLKKIEKSFNRKYQKVLSADLQTYLKDMGSIGVLNTIRRKYGQKPIMIKSITDALNEERYKTHYPGLKKELGKSETMTLKWILNNWVFLKNNDKKLGIDDIMEIDIFRLDKKGRYDISLIIKVANEMDLRLLGNEGQMSSPCYNLSIKEEVQKMKQLRSKTPYKQMPKSEWNKMLDLACLLCRYELTLDLFEKTKGPYPNISSTNAVRMDIIRTADKHNIKNLDDKILYCTKGREDYF